MSFRPRNLVPLVAVLLDRGPVDRIGGLVHQLVEEIGSRRLERDLQRVIVNGLDAQLVGLQFVLVDLFGVLDGIEDVGVFGGGRRILETLVGEDEVAGGDRVAV